MDFSGKVVLVTGAGSGFGRMAAVRFASAGARVALVDVREEALREVARELGAAEGRALCLTGDVSREGDVAAFVERTVARFGQLDIALNNAGLGHSMKRLVDLTEQELDPVLAVNLKGVFFCMKHEIRVMLGRGSGVILNTASAAGLVGAPFLSGYAATKHAVVGLTKSAAIEFGRKGIRINAICPYFSPTPMVDGLVQEKGEALPERLASHVPLGRLAQPREIVEAMLWMCSDENTFMNGAAVPIDGGLTAG